MLKLAISVGLAAMLLPAVAAAQSAPDIASKLRLEYDSCVYGAVGSQWKAQPRIDPNIATEVAFQSCLTEEQGMRAVLGAVDVSYSQIESTIVGIKLNLKRKVREIMADPGAYLRKHGG
jgi:hypothetical protein